jgi:hypothetical protein
MFGPERQTPLFPPIVHFKPKDSTVPDAPDPGHLLAKIVFLTRDVDGSHEVPLDHTHFLPSRSPSRPPWQELAEPVTFWLTHHDIQEDLPLSDRLGWNAPQFG